MSCTRHYALRCDVGRHNENFLFLQKKMRYCVCLSKELSSNTNPQERKIFRRIIKMVHLEYGNIGCRVFKRGAKLYIPGTLNIDLILWHTQLIVCSKMLNHGLNHGLFLSLFKLIPCPIHWIVYVIAYSNFMFEV